MNSTYQKPKSNFGEIINANFIISRDLNKDNMNKYQKISQVKILSKKYPFKQSNNISKIYYKK